MTTERADAMNMNPSTMLRAFCDAVEQRNGKAFAELFTEDGVYHDVFYGAFEGRAKIAGLIDDWFYRTASDFRWDMHDPVSNGEMLEFIAAWLRACSEYQLEKIAVNTDDLGWSTVALTV